MDVDIPLCPFCGACMVGIHNCKMTLTMSQIQAMLSEETQYIGRYHDGTPDDLRLKDGRRRWDCILERMPPGPIEGVEVGVLKGEMSAALLRQRPDLFLWLVDIAQRDKALVKTSEWAERRNHIWEHSPRAAKHFKDDSLDFVFIDADHGYEACKADIIAWLPKVKPGGWLCGHDYHKRYECGGVNKAVKEMLPVHDLDQDDTWFYAKP